MSIPTPGDNRVHQDWHYFLWLSKFPSSIIQHISGNPKQVKASNWLNGAAGLR